MASDGVSAANPANEFRWWFLPSWLGLDAPCVVLTWTWAVSRSLEAALPARPAAAMFLVVWSIYLADRLIDVVRCRDWDQATGRLRFGRRYWPLFLACLGVCLVGIVTLLVMGLPVAVLQRATWIALGLVVHFLVFVVPVVLRDKLPGKEFGVGLFFALGAFACLGDGHVNLSLLIAIALLVAFNCLIIAAKDADNDRANDPGGASRWWRTMNRDLRWIGVGMTIVSVLWTLWTGGSAAFFASTAAAFLALTLLHGFSAKLSGDAVRALADFALLTPIPIVGINSGLS